MPDPTRFSSLADRIQSDHLAPDVPSLAVGVAMEGEIIWEHGFGLADRENDILASADIPYSLASITKPITATALMVLVERGEVDLDCPIAEYLDVQLKAHVGDAKDVTLRRLASHTAGLPLHYRFFYEDQNWPPAAVEDVIRDYGILITPPGERFNYANLGFGIIERVIEIVSGTSYADFCAEAVFGPLGMTHSAIGPPTDVEAAVRYSRAGDRVPFYDFAHRGASAAFCSVHDLLRFSSFHLKNPFPGSTPILSGATLDEMKKPSVRFYGNEGYGIGWWVEERLNTDVIGHPGDMGGVTTRLAMVPSENLAVAVLCNTENGPVRPVLDEILSEVVPKYGSARAEAQKASRQERTPFQAPKELVGSWSGSVDVLGDSTPVILTVLDDGDIHVRVGSDLASLVNTPRWADNCLKGRALGYLPGDPSRARRNHLVLDLTLREKALAGAISVSSFPEDRSGNGLSYWTELRRDE